MTQSLIALFVLFAAALFYYDIRRRARAHQQSIHKEKSEIATMTHMTATMSTFSDGTATEALLAASEDSQLFFYRLIVKGKVVLRYTLALPNVTGAELRINGEKRTFQNFSSHKTASLRATDISQQVRRDLTPDEYAAIREVALNISFKSEDGKTKMLPVRVFREPAPQMRAVLPKILENAVWWQHFLNMQGALAPAGEEFADFGAAL